MNAIADARRIVRRYQLVAFLAITIAWSWGYWTLLWIVLGPERTTYLHTMPGLWGPLVAAALVTRASGASVRDWLRDVAGPRVDARWYALAAGGFLLLSEVETFATVLLVDGSVELSSPLSVVVGFLVAFLVGGALEEFGLRGFAHPRLRRRYGTVAAGAIVGVPWALWHLPLQSLGIGFGGSFPLFLAFVIPASVLLGWLYDAASGSVTVAMVGHAAVDAPGLLEPVGTVPESVAFASQVAVVSAYWLLAGVVVVYTMAAGLSPDRGSKTASTEEPPRR